MYCVICSIPDFMGRSQSLLTRGIRFRTRLFGSVWFFLVTWVSSREWHLRAAAFPPPRLKPPNQAPEPLPQFLFEVTLLPHRRKWPLSHALGQWSYLHCPATVSDQPLDSRLKDRAQNHFVPAWGMLCLSGNICLVSGTRQAGKLRVSWASTSVTCPVVLLRS